MAHPAHLPLAVFNHSHVGPELADVIAEVITQQLAVDSLEQRQPLFIAREPQIELLFLSNCSHKHLGAIFQNTAPCQARGGLIWPECRSPHGLLLLLDYQLEGCQVLAVDKRADTVSVDELREVPTCVDSHKAVSIH